MLKATELKKDILSHLLTPIGPMPAVLDPDGVYPYQSYVETSSRSVIKEYRFIKLENEKLDVLICLDLGGKVYSIIHKASGKEVLYVPEVIRHSRILPRFYFVAGGIEVSFPISHTPSQNERVHYDIFTDKDRIYVSVGETELRFGMQWTVEYSLGENDAYLTQRTVFKNPTDQPHPWMSWSNAAITAHDDTLFHFPNGPVLVHDDDVKTINWKDDGPIRNSEIMKMSGYFWQKPDCNAFGCFTPSTGTGLYHVADLEKVEGIKLWSYGSGRDLEWSYLSSLNKQSYLEIQAGPIADQSIKYELGVNETHHQVEYWIPSGKILEIENISLPKVYLRPLGEVPMFSYARSHDVEVWLLLIRAYEIQDINEIPEPPSFKLACWAPGGIRNLEPAFRWAIENDKTDHVDEWKLYFGIWLIAEAKMERAISVLSESTLDLALAILGRVFLFLGKPKKSLVLYRKMKEKTLTLHPQIVVERDKALAACGPETLLERELWLDCLNALEDEMIIERRISLLFDMEKYEDARDLLLTTKFQKIHQRYERKKLWEIVCEKLNTEIEPYPDNLGEDNLAQFGAYREFDD